MSETNQRAYLLYAQGRHDMAEKEIRRALAQQPDDPQAHAFLSLCLIQQDRYPEAQREAREAVRLGPDRAQTHYALGYVLLKSDRRDEALIEADYAIALNPFDPDYFGLLAGIQLERRNWPAALEAAQRGLEVDPEHVGCTNLRAMALVKLGRRSEAGATIGAALAKDPDDPVTHANQGWALLHAGEHVKSMEHFREALRLDPNMEWARFGIVEALKARNFIYRWMLMYFLWMSRLSGRAQWVIIIGAFLGARLVRSLAQTQPDLAPVLWPLLYAYFGFVLLTWLADPLFNLLLRLNRFGRLALSREQTIAANIIGCALAVALSFAAAYALGFHAAYGEAALMSGLLVLPLAGAFRCSAGWPRYVMLAACGALAMTGSLAIYTGIAAQSAGRHDLEQISSHLTGVFVLGIMAGSILANVLAGVRVRK